MPTSSGVYAWFFSSIPDSVPTEDCVRCNGMTLLYVGISPQDLGSGQTLKDRLRYHYRGNAEGSTLRRTLGCLLEKTKS